MAKSLIPIRIVLLVAIVSCFGVGCTKEAKRARLLDRADNNFKSGAYDKAKIEYLNVLQLGGQDVVAISRLGQMWFEQGAPHKAASFLIKTRELSPNDLANRLRLARTYSALGHPAEAKSEALFVLQHSPANGEALMFLTEIVVGPEETSAAEQALEKFPERDTPMYQLAVANMAMRKLDLTAAKTAITRALLLEAESPEAHERMALLYLLQKDSSGAKAEFRTAAELASPRSQMKIVYADYEARTGEAGTAKKFLESLTSKTPDFLSAWILLSRVAVTEGNYDKALALLENVVFRDSDNLDARLLQASCWLGKHETQKAVSVLETLDRAYPGAPVIKFQLARAELQDNQPLQAAVSLRGAIAAKPDYAEAILLLAEINLRRGETAQVIPALEELFKNRPDLSETQTLLAEAYKRAGRLEEAEAILRKQIELSPKKSELYLSLGVLERQQEKTEEARSSFGRALELSPDNAEAINQLVSMDLEAKDFAGAMRKVEHRIEKDPKDPISYLLAGKVEAAKKEWLKAETALKKAITLNPNLAPARDLLVAVYISSDRLQEAHDEIEATLLKSPKNQAALMILASIEERQNEYAKAALAYEKVLAFEPNSVAALNNLAYLLGEQLNQGEKAVKLARKARSLAPDNPAVADTLGWVMLKRGDYQQALDLSQEAASRVPDNPEIQFHLGMAHYMMGQTDRARSAFQRALAASHDFPDKAETQRRLSLLKQTDTGPNAPTLGQMEEVLAQYPDDVLARIRLGDRYEKENAFDRAATAYEQALESNPKLASVALKLAQLYSGPLNNRQKALALAKKARDLAPADPQVAGLLGQVAFSAGNMAWAYSLLQESVHQLADATPFLYDFAWAAYRVGKTEEAQSAMQELVNASPTAPHASEAREFLAMLVLGSKPTEVVPAEAEINKVLATDADYVPALMARATVQIQRDQSEDAVETLQHVLRIFPDFAPAQKRLAALYMRDSGKGDVAYELATQARKTLPEDPELTEILAEISYRKREYGRAIQLLRESALRSPLDARALFFLGMSQLQTKQESEGRETLERALAAALDEPWATDAKRAIKQLSGRN